MSVAEPGCVTGPATVVALASLPRRDHHDRERVQERLHRRPCATRGQRDGCRHPHLPIRVLQAGRQGRRGRRTPKDRQALCGRELQSGVRSLQLPDQRLHFLQARRQSTLSLIQTAEVEPEVFKINFGGRFGVFVIETKERF